MTDWILDLMVQVFEEIFVGKSRLSKTTSSWNSSIVKKIAPFLVYLHLIIHDFILIQLILHFDYFDDSKCLSSIQKKKKKDLSDLIGRKKQ